MPLIEELTIETYEARKKIVLEITKKFNIERYIYLIISILSFFLIIYVAIDLYTSNNIKLSQLSLFIGPTGFMAYAISRILFMWTKSLKIIITGNF